ncbi:MAG: CZB domain-containing protein [Sulfurimonas sp.]|jgi:hypothetical protein|nr:CZB domain-containing protein [Sulfurimonas sp.]
MNKDEILTHLREAKLAHKNWVQKAKLLIEGFKVEKDAIPVNATSCEFGCWFYKEAQKLNALRNNPLECMQNIEEYHSRLHTIYLNIFKIYYSHYEANFLQKLFGTKRKVTSTEKEIAISHYEEIEAVSKQLIDELNRMERRIIALGDAEIEKIK